MMKYYTVYIMVLTNLVLISMTLFSCYVVMTKNVLLGIVFATIVIPAIFTTAKMGFEITKEEYYK